MEEEREEGDSTKLHLKLGLSPLESPSTLSPWHSWEASELRHGSSIEMKKRLLHQGDNCQSAGGVQWELLTSRSLCPADPHTPTPTSVPTRFPHPPSWPAKGTSLERQIKTAADF